jgi:hypothetical protein
MVPKPGLIPSREEERDWGIPVYRPIGIRHEGDVNVGWALVRNAGTCRSDVKEKATSGKNP